jgi:hypothetical protein
VSTDPILITVDSATNRAALSLSPLARALLESTPPPASRRSDRVALTMLVPSDTVFAGQQVDVIATAWIPRELRERMRRPPLVTLVTPEGVWAYPATPSSGGPALSRQVSGAWMDLFVTHQVVFPLVPGRLIIPPASVDYALPVTFSFFSREERFALRSDSIAIAVLPLPASAANPGTNVVGQGLRLDLSVDPAATRVGEPIDAAVTISGAGNVALWPSPEPLRWPPGFRVYPAQTEVLVEPDAGRIAGSKTFHFLAVPDSSGNFVLPEVRYTYFDPGARRYEVARAAPRAVVVAPGAEPRAARALPPLIASVGEGPADRLTRGFGWQGWLAVLLLPPLLAWAWSRRRPVPIPEPRAPKPQATPLAQVEREFLAVLASHVSDPAARAGDGLAPALRAAGVDSAVADHVKRLRDRLRAARYGPRGLGDGAELAAEIQQVLRVLGAEGQGVQRRPHATVTPIVLLIVAASAWPPSGSRLAAQSPSAEALFEAGALRAATDSFAARAARDPRDAAHWYNLGATLYRAGADGRATVAWTQAARLAPRDAAIRRARRLLPPQDPITEQLLEVGWATPAEWAIVGTAAWLVLWLAVAVGTRRRLVLGVLVGVAVTSGVLGVFEWRRRDRPVVVVTADSAPVRAAPYGGATAASTIPGGGALLAGRTYGPWREVHRGDGIHGWVLGGEIAGL